MKLTVAIRPDNNCATPFYNTVFWLDAAVLGSLTIVTCYSPLSDIFPRNAELINLHYFTLLGIVCIILTPTFESVNLRIPSTHGTTVVVVVIR